MNRPLTCSCGAEFTPEQARERSIGDVTYDGEVLLCFNCDQCRSTRAMVLVPHPSAVLERVYALEVSP